MLEFMQECKMKMSPKYHKKTGIWGVNYSGIGFLFAFISNIRSL